MRIAIFHELPIKSGSRKSVDKIAEYLSKNNSIDLFYVDKAKSYSRNNPYKKIFFSKFIPIEWNGGNPLAKLNRDTLELVKLFFLHKKISQEIRQRKYDIRSGSVCIFSHILSLLFSSLLFSSLITDPAVHLLAWHCSAVAAESTARSHRCS